MNTHKTEFLLGTAAPMLLISGWATTHKVRTGLVYGGDRGDVRRCCRDVPLNTRWYTCSRMVAETKVNATVK